MEIAIVRAAHLHVFVDELRHIGVPVESALTRSRLPPWALEDPDAYVSFALCLEWLARCSRDVELMEFGFRAARRTSLDSLGGPIQRVILDAPTGYARIGALQRCAAFEDNVLAIRMWPEGDQVRVVSTMEGFRRNPSICLGEWIDLQAIIAIVRSVAGPRWCPREMTFVSRERPTAVVQEAFPDTRILVGWSCTSILVGSDLLSRACAAGGARQTDRTCPPSGSLPDNGPAGWDFAAALRAAVRPYLADGYPALNEMAEAFQMSARTLQRRLHQCGHSYGDIVQEARYDLARELFLDPTARVIDIALATGYGSPQHFARAFRRYAGVSPTTFRKSIAEAG